MNAEISTGVTNCVLLRGAPNALELSSWFEDARYFLFPMKFAQLVAFLNFGPIGFCFTGLVRVLKR